MNHLPGHQGGGGVDFQQIIPSEGATSPAKVQAGNSELVHNTEITEPRVGGSPELSFGKYAQATPGQALQNPDLMYQQNHALIPQPKLAGITPRFAYDSSSYRPPFSRSPGFKANDISTWMTYNDLRYLSTFSLQNSIDAWEVIHAFKRIAKPPIPTDIGYLFTTFTSMLPVMNVNRYERLCLFIGASTCWDLIAVPFFENYIIDFPCNEMEFVTKTPGPVVKFIHQKQNIFKYVLTSWFLNAHFPQFVTIHNLRKLVILLEKLVNLGCQSVPSSVLSTQMNSAILHIVMSSLYHSNGDLHLRQLGELLTSIGYKGTADAITSALGSSSSFRAVAKPVEVAPSAPPASGLMRHLGSQESRSALDALLKTLSPQEKASVKETVKNFVIEVEKVWTQPHIQEGLKALLRQSKGSKNFNLSLRSTSDVDFFKEVVAPLSDFHKRHHEGGQTSEKAIYQRTVGDIIHLSGLCLDFDEKMYHDHLSALFPGQLFKIQQNVFSKKYNISPFFLSLTDTTGFEEPLCTTLFSLMLKELHIFAKHLPALDNIKYKKCTTQDACFLYYRDEKFEVYPLQMQIVEFYPTFSSIGLDGDHRVSRRLQASIPALRTQSPTGRGFSLTIAESKQLLDFYQKNQSNFYLLTAPQEPKIQRNISPKPRPKSSEDEEKESSTQAKPAHKQKKSKSSEPGFNSSDFQGDLSKMDTDYEEEVEESGALVTIAPEKAEFAVPRAPLPSSMQLIASPTNPFNEAIQELCLVSVKKISRQLIRHRGKETDKEIFTHTKPLTELLAILSAEGISIDLEDSLKRYQHKAVSWMLGLSKDHLGSILASAPGLGKTRQAIEYSRQLQRKDVAGNPVIVVVPNSIAAQWRDEVLKILFAQRKKALVELIQSCTQEGIQKLGEALYLACTSQEREIGRVTVEKQAALEQRKREVYEIATQAAKAIPQLPFEMADYVKTATERNFWFAFILSSEEARLKLADGKMLDQTLNGFRYQSLKQDVKGALLQNKQVLVMKQALDACDAITYPAGQNALKTLASSLKTTPKTLPSGAPCTLYDSLVTTDMYEQVLVCTAETPKTVLDKISNSVKWKIIIVSDTSLKDNGKNNPQTILARLSQLSPKAVIWDEAHTRTWKMDATTKVFAASALDFLTKMQKKGAHRVLLTGTPFVNTYRETVSLVQLANPHLDLSSFMNSVASKEQEFKKQLTIYLKKPEKLEKEEFVKECTQSFFDLFTAYEHLRIIFKKLFCVHENRDPAIREDWGNEIPEKKSTEIPFTLSAEQRVSLDRISENSKMTPVIQRVAENIIFHPEFEKPEWRLEGKEVYKKVASWSDTQIAKFIQASGFLTTFFSDTVKNPLVKAIQDGESFVIVVSQIKHGATLEAIIKRRYPRTRSLFFSGDETLEVRDRIVETFEESAARTREPGSSTIVILSLKAGGTGLNLKAGRRLFNLAPWWNDAVSEQVEARIIRAGTSGDRDIYTYNSQHPVQHHLEKIVKAKQQQKEYFFSKNGDYTGDTALNVVKSQIKLMLDYFQVECMVTPTNPLDYEFTTLFEKIKEQLEEFGEDIVFRLNEATTFTRQAQAIAAPSPLSLSSTTAAPAPKKQAPQVAKKVTPPTLPQIKPQVVAPVLAPHPVPQTLTIPVGTSKDLMSCVPTLRPHTKEEALVLFSRLLAKEKAEEGFIEKFLKELKQLSQESSIWLELWNTPASQKRHSSLSTWCGLQESMTPAPCNYNVEIYELKENRLVKNSTESDQNIVGKKNCRLLKRVNSEERLCYALLIK